MPREELNLPPSDSKSVTLPLCYWAIYLILDPLSGIEPESQPYQGRVLTYSTTRAFYNVLRL